MSTLGFLLAGPSESRTGTAGCAPPPTAPSALSGPAAASAASVTGFLLPAPAPAPAAADVDVAEGRLIAPARKVFWKSFFFLFGLGGRAVAGFGAAVAGAGGTEEVEGWGSEDLLAATALPSSSTRHFPRRTTVTCAHFRKPSNSSCASWPFRQRSSRFSSSVRLRKSTSSWSRYCHWFLNLSFSSNADCLVSWRPNKPQDGMRGQVKGGDGLCALGVVRRDSEDRIPDPAPAAVPVHSVGTQLRSCPSKLGTRRRRT